jgi:hypothetical protein
LSLQHRVEIGLSQSTMTHFWRAQVVLLIL